MNWSTQQTEALNRVRDWANARQDPVFYLGGYAGSGKTTLAREFATEHGGIVEFGAFTGKAALVLSQKGCLGARTLHSLMYLPSPKSKQHLRDMEEELGTLLDGDSRRKVLEEDIEEEKQRVQKPSWTVNQGSSLLSADLVIVDEVSMVDERIGADLLSFEKPILVLGDPAQLPPVKGTGYFTNRDPDFMLTEIHRQAADSPVLQLATKVRNRGTLVAGQYGTSQVLHPKSLGPTQAATFDQIICGKNVTRKEINRQVRRVLGFHEDLPAPGDKLVCLRNDKATQLLNGSMWTVLASHIVDADKMQLFIQDLDSSNSQTVTAWRHGFEGREIPWYSRRDGQEFDFGYAVTCHKAQGSQWANVLVYDQSAVFRADRYKWLYTALTRASESVTIVQTN